MLGLVLIGDPELNIGTLPLFYPRLVPPLLWSQGSMGSCCSLWISIRLKILEDFGFGCGGEGYLDLGYFEGLFAYLGETTLLGSWEVIGDGSIFYCWQMSGRDDFSTLRWERERWDDELGT